MQFNILLVWCDLMFCLMEHKNFTCLMEFCTSLAGGIQHFGEIIFFF